MYQIRRIFIGFAYPVDIKPAYHQNIINKQESGTKLLAEFNNIIGQ